MQPKHIELCLFILTFINVFYFTGKHEKKKWYVKTGLSILLILISTVLGAILGLIDMILPGGYYLHYTVDIMSFVIVNVEYYTTVRKRVFTKYEKAFIEMNSGNSFIL